MHRTPEPPPGGGSRSFDKLAWRPTHGAYLALAKHAQEACALRRPQGRPDGHAGAPSWRGRGGAASTRLGAKRPAAALRRERSMLDFKVPYQTPIAACAAASRAIGTRNGLQLT